MTGTANAGLGWCSPHQGSGRCCYSYWGMMRKSFWCSATLLEDHSHLSWAFWGPSPGSVRVFSSPCHAWRWTAGFWGKISRWERAAAPPSWWAPHPSSSSTGPLAAANLFPVKLILEGGHPKMNNEIMTILHHGLSPCSQEQRAEVI